jgi:hypothetical protein
MLLMAAAIVVARAGLWERPGPAGSRPGQDGQAAARPLPGVPLRDPSGLRLLVASDPAPFVLDVDTGAIRPVTGLPTDGGRSVHVEPVGEDAVVVTRRDCRGSDCDAGDSAAYLVRRGGPDSALLTADGALRRLPQVVDGVAGGDLMLSTLERGRLIALTDLRDGTGHRLRWRQLPDMPLRLAPADRR